MSLQDPLTQLSATLAEAMHIDTLQKHKKKIISLDLKNEIYQEASLLSKVIGKGKSLFLQYGVRYNVEAIFKKIEANMRQAKNNKDSSKGFRVMSSEDYWYLFDIAFKIYNQNKLEEVGTMLALLSFLQPGVAKTCILQATIVWKLKGCAEAAKIYDVFTNMFQDPYLYLYAADCHKYAGHIEKSKELLDKALLLSNNLQASDKVVLHQEINKLLNKAVKNMEEAR